MLSISDSGLSVVPARAFSSVDWFIQAVVACCFLLIAACGGKDDRVGDSSSGTQRARDMFFVTGEIDLVQISIPGDTRKTVLHFKDSAIIDASVSPDGRRIAFARVPNYTPTTTDFAPDLYIADRDGKNPTLLVKHEIPTQQLRLPSWLSDGRTVIFQVTERSTAGTSFVHRLEKVDVGSGARTRFIEGGYTPSVSRDGKSIVFTTFDLDTAQSTIWITDESDRARRPVVASSPTLNAFGSSVLSPDGSKLAFGAASIGAEAPRSRSNQAFISRKVSPAYDPARLLTDGLPEDIWLVNSDGSGLRRLAILGEDQPWLAWSSDGRLVYSMGSMGLIGIDVSTGGNKVLRDGIYHGQLSWVPP